MVFPLVVDAADGITTETGEAGGQPQVSYDGGANWANTTGVLTGGTNGSYQVQLTADEVNQSVGTNILGRYKSIRTAEARAIPIQIVAFDPHAVTDLGLSNLDAAISTRGTADTGDQMDLINAPNATAITAIQSGLSTLTAQQVWEYGTRTISSFGSLVSDIATAVWAAAVRTITGGTISTVSDKTDYSLTSAYDAAKAAAPAGAQMDLVNAPNATAIAAIQSGIATSAEIAALNDLSSAEAQSAAAAALAAYDPPTKAEMDAGLAGIDPPTTSEITTAVWAAATRSLTDKADFTLTADYDAAKTAAPAGAQMDLVNAPNATAITAIQSGLSTLTAQQVWEYGTRTISSFGSLVSDIATAVWAAAVRTITGGAISTVSDKTDYSLTSAYDAAKTAAPAGAQMDLVNAPNATAITAIQSGIATSAEIAALNDLSSAEAQSAAAAALVDYDPPTKAEMDAGLAGINPPTTSEITTAVWAAVTRSLTDKADFTLTAAYDAAKAAASATDVATVDTVVNAIKAKTDNLPASPAAVGSAMTLTSGERTAIADAVLDEEIDSAGATDDTLRAAAKAAWAQGFGKWTLVDTTLSLYGPDGASVVREFTVDDADSPTQRLPA